MIKAKAFDASRLKFSEPMRIIGGNYTIPIRYDGRPLLVQLPRSTISRGVYDQDGKHYIDALLNENSTVVQMVRQLEALASRHIQTLTRDDLQDCQIHSHLSMVRGSEGRYYALRLKAPRIGQRYQVHVQDERGQLRNVCRAQGGTTVLIVAAIESVYCINGIGGFNLNIRNMMICDDDTGSADRLTQISDSLS